MSEERPTSVSSLFHGLGRVQLGEHRSWFRQARWEESCLVSLEHRTWVKSKLEHVRTEMLSTCKRTAVFFVMGVRRIDKVLS